MELVPGTGPYAACVPGAFDAWLLLLRDHGTWELADVLVLRDRLRAGRVPRAAGDRQRDLADRSDAGRTSLALWRPERRRGCATRCWRETYSRLAAVTGASREARIDAARDAWYRGWVAEAMTPAGFLTA